MSGTTPPYRRRKPSLIRNFWVYRRLVLSAAILGLILWFVVINSTPVTIFFPFGLGQLASTSGMVILLSALFGSVATGLVFTLVLALRRAASGAPASEPEKAGPDERVELVDDLPPPDYASKTPEGFPPSNWS